MGNPNLSAETVFMQAERFHTGTLVLQRYLGPGKQNIGMPTIFLELIAAELYLKTILFIETGAITKGHNLKNIFERLSSASRRRLSKKWDAYFAASPYNKLPDDLKKEMVSTAFASILGQAAAIYEKTRYLWEDRPGAMFALSGIANLPRDDIVEVYGAQIGVQN